MFSLQNPDNGHHWSHNGTKGEFFHTHIQPFYGGGTSHVNSHTRGGMDAQFSKSRFTQTVWGDRDTDLSKITYNTHTGLGTGTGNFPNTHVTHIQRVGDRGA